MKDGKDGKIANHRIIVSFTLQESFAGLRWDPHISVVYAIEGVFSVPTKCLLWTDLGLATYSLTLGFRVMEELLSGHLQSCDSEGRDYNTSLSGPYDFG